LCGYNYSEHVASLFDTTRVADYTTLPAELKAGAIERARNAAVAAAPSGDYADGAPRFFTCQTCHMPPVQGKGCNKNGAQSLHLANNNGIPDALDIASGTSADCNGNGAPDECEERKIRRVQGPPQTVDWP
jgi:hypothetical protein